MNILGFKRLAQDATAKFKLGTVSGDIDTEGPQKLYKYVQYAEGTAAIPGVAGEVVGYATAGASQDNIVSSDYSDGVSVGAGVLQTPLADGECGWIQIAGPATLTIALTSGADGNALTLVGAGDGTLAVSGLVTDHVCAVADDASAKEIQCCFPI